jgi:YHS domain-containing protein
MCHLSRRSFVSAAVAVAFYGGGAAAQTAAPSAGARVALKGYDPVSYFTDGKPEQGSKDFTFAYDDATYWFKSAAHRDKFAANPERYAPQFDGYCAVQLSWGHKVEADPQAWAITDGKLYVFSIKKGVKKFKSETVAIVEKAKENWPKLRNQKTEPFKGPPSPGHL